MTEEHAAPAVSVLFHPRVVPVIDVFRLLGRLKDQCDLAILDGPERDLSAYVRRENAKTIISDTLMLAFALSRQGMRELRYRPLRSRSGTKDEYGLMVMIGARVAGDMLLAREAAAMLGLGMVVGVSPLMEELSRQIGFGRLVFDLPTLPEFRAMIGGSGFSSEPFDDLFAKQDFHFRF